MPASGSPFGALLRQYRVALGLSQEALAERAGMTTQGIGALERGSRRHPYPETVRRLADALGLSADARAAFAATVPSPRAGSPSLAAQSETERAALEESAVPAQSVPLVGREAEVTAVTALLCRGKRLVTLTGPAGVGKTRLALRLAADLRENYSRGSVFVDLTSLRDPALVLSHIGRTLGIRDTGERSTAETLRSALAGHSLLLVVDNFEHVLAAASHVPALLAAAHGLTILATSREPLRLRDEHEVAVAPLRLPVACDEAHLAALAAVPSVALFVERARDVRPTLLLSAANAFPIAEVCRRLDGLPLALELAAARLKILSPASLLARLEQRLDLLTDTMRDAPARHHTLRAAVGWSYDLLAPEEQALFRRMAVFDGGCTVESVEAVCAAPPVPPAGNPDLLDHLVSLVDKNLLVCANGPDGTPRFSMLETVRAFACDMLRASGDEAMMREAHARHVVALVEEIEQRLWGPEQVSWIARLAAEQDNVRSAFRWLLCRGHLGDVARLLRRLIVYWWIQGQVSEAEHWARETLAFTTDLSPEAAAYAHLALGWMGAGRRDARAGAHGDRAYQLACTLGDEWIKGMSLICSGIVRHLRGDVAGGTADLWEARRLLSEADDGWGVGFTLTALSGLALARGDQDDAERFAESHLEMARKMSDLRSIAQALDSLAFVALLRGDTMRAETLLVESVALSWEVGHHELVSYGIHGLAVAAAPADAMRSARLYGAAEALREAAGAVMWPPRRHLYDRSAEAVRDAVGAADCVARAEGRAMSGAAAVAYALQGVTRSR